jgi:hypothetical protein
MHFRNKKRQYLKDKSDEVATKNKSKTCIEEQMTLSGVTNLKLT